MFFIFKDIFVSKISIETESLVTGRIVQSNCLKCLEGTFLIASNSLVIHHDDYVILDRNGWAKIVWLIKFRSISNIIRFRQPFRILAFDQKHLFEIITS